MKIITRRVQNYLSVNLVEDKTEFDFGLLDRKQVMQLYLDLETAMDDLQWFLNVTEE